MSFAERLYYHTQNKCREIIAQFKIDLIRDPFLLSFFQEMQYIAPMEDFNISKNDFNLQVIQST